MILKMQNSLLIKNQPSTLLTAAVSATGTTLTVKSNDGFAQNDYVLIGKIGEDKTEIKLISAAVTAGTSLTIAAMTYDHEVDTTITKIDYNQICFYNATTATGDKTLLTTKDISPSEIYTLYDDQTYTTGYGFARFKDSNTTTYSLYSDAIPYTGYTKKMLREMRKKVRRLLNEPDESAITDEEINDEIDLAHKEICHSRMWSAYEDTKSFSSVANQYEYDLATSVATLYEAKYDTQPLAVIDVHRWNTLRWDSDTTGDPTHICMWARKARVYPYPDSSAATTAIDDADDITATDTTITVDSTASFRTQGRVIIDSEVISYTGTTSTTFTGCTRGEEGTTAATHADDATVTERDFVYHYQKDPDNLDDETDATLLFDPAAIIYKASAELALQLEEQELHDRLIAKYDRAYRLLEKADQTKYKSSFGRVKDVSEVVNDYGVLRDPNQYPTGITTA